MAAKTVDGYMASVPDKTRRILEKVRATIRKAAPGADERLSYRMPTFFLEGVLAHVGAFKNHIGLFPPVRGDRTLMEAIAPYAGEKGNLRFPLDGRIPYGLIARIVRLRVQQNRARAAGRHVRPAGRLRRSREAPWSWPPASATRDRSSGAVRRSGNPVARPLARRGTRAAPGTRPRTAESGHDTFFENVETEYTETPPGASHPKEVEAGMLHTGLAPCGIDCSKCPAYVATQRGDKTKLEEVLETWASDPEMTVDDLLCDGCQGERVSRDCRECWIKDCVRREEVETCAECRRYPCAALETEWSEWHVTDPVAARARLDARRKALHRP